MKKVALSTEDQRRIDEGVGHLAGILGEIYGDASEVEVLIGLAVSAAHAHGIDRAAFFHQVHEVYGHVSDFRDRLNRFEADLGEVDETEDERTEPVGRELLS